MNKKASSYIENSENIEKSKSTEDTDNITDTDHIEQTENIADAKNIEDIEENPNLALTERRNLMLCKSKKQKEILKFALLCVFCASFVMIGQYTFWDTNEEFEEPIFNIQTVSYNESCRYRTIVGDGYCDDEANTPECFYDLQDCCDYKSDRNQCQNCTCITTILNTSCTENCLVDRMLWGDKICDLNMNNPENRFDSGDCCIEGVICTIQHDEIIDCPENPCVKANNFCVPNELGDGICQDHNNGPFCDHDLGDCCLANRFQSGECGPCFCTEDDDPLSSGIIG